MKHDGFTLIEFIVIMSIFSIMASIALFNFQGFRSNVGVNNLAQDIALLMRQAQTFGWATRTDQGIVDQGQIERYAHGVYFGHDGSLFSPEIILYTKQSPIPGSEYYVNLDDTIADTISIQGTYAVVGVRSAPTRSDLKITAGEIPQNQTLTVLDQAISIAFSRPRPEALIFLQNPPMPATDQFLGIYIGPSDQTVQAEKLIIVSRSGEIWVE